MPKWPCCFSSLEIRVESGGRIGVVFFNCLTLFLENTGSGVERPWYEKTIWWEIARQPRRCAKLPSSEVSKWSFVGMHCLPSRSVWPCRWLCLGGWGRADLTDMATSNHPRFFSSAYDLQPFGSSKQTAMCQHVVFSACFFHFVWLADDRWGWATWPLRDGVIGGICGSIHQELTFYKKKLEKKKKN